MINLCKLHLTQCVLYGIFHICHIERNDYMSDVERKRFTTTIDPDILLSFKVTCTKQKKDMNEVLEMLMTAFSDGVIKLDDIEE